MFDRAPSRGPDPRLTRYDHLVVHCTATVTILNADAAWVDGVHRTRGWSMCGYHAVIPRRGEWQDDDGGFRARPIGRSGAHVGACGRGWNGRSFGVALAGGLDSGGRPDMNFSAVQMETLHAGILHFLLLHPDPQSVTVLGHRDLIARTDAPPKACPCFDVRAWLELPTLEGS